MLVELSAVAVGLPVAPILIYSIVKTWIMPSIIRVMHIVLSHGPVGHPTTTVILSSQRSWRREESPGAAQR